jgi:hypothetical protein
VEVEVEVEVEVDMMGVLLRAGMGVMGVPAVVMRAARRPVAGQQR